jgi:RNA polymerase-binding transcription factor DksA
MTTIADRKRALHARRAELLGRLETVEEGLDSHGEKDWEELAIEWADDEVLEDLGAAAANELRMITAALARIKEGEYGYCTVCGSEIAAERLDIVPATPFCATCAAKI